MFIPLELRLIVVTLPFWVFIPVRGTLTSGDITYYMSGTGSDFNANSVLEARRTRYYEPVQQNL